MIFFILGRNKELQERKWLGKLLSQRRICLCSHFMPIIFLISNLLFSLRVLVLSTEQIETFWFSTKSWNGLSTNLSVRTNQNQTNSKFYPPLELRPAENLDHSPTMCKTYFHGNDISFKVHSGHITCLDIIKISFELLHSRMERAIS